MARATLNKTTLLGSYPTLPLSANSADIVMTAVTGSSGSSGNQIAWSDAARLLVVVWNTDGVNPYTVTFTSVADPRNNRTGDISAYTLQAGDHAFFLFERAGWYQSDAMLYCEGNNAAVKIGACAV
jgi:hypothetical protein